MNWLVLLVPELALRARRLGACSRGATIDRCTDTRLTLTDDEIVEVNRRVGLVYNTDRHITVAILIGIPMVILIGSGGGILLLGMLQSVGLSKTQALWAAGLGLPLVLATGWIALFSRLYRRHVRQALVECGHPVCLGCGYLMEGVDGAVCPECGRAVTEAAE